MSFAYGGLYVLNWFISMFYSTFSSLLAFYEMSNVFSSEVRGSIADTNKPTVEVTKPQGFQPYHPYR